MRKFFTFLLLFSLCHCRVYAFICEQADLIFRNFGGNEYFIPEGFSWPMHTGIYYKYTGGDPNDFNNHVIIEAPGTQGVWYQTFAYFYNKTVFQGAYRRGITAAQRKQIITVARNRIGFPYPPATALWCDENGACLDLLTYLF